MSSSQRRAVLTLLGLMVAGQGVRLWLLSPGQAPGAVTLLQPASTPEVASQRAASARAGRPLGAGERLDLNVADAAALSRLPGVGAGLARRIVEDRAAHGPYRTLGDLDRVPGIGPALLRRVGAFVVQPDGPPTPLPGPSLAVDQLAGPSAGATSRRDPGKALVDLNSAGEAELLRLPGIGPTKARAIMAYRQARGPFASVGDLIGVPGIGPSTLAGLAGLVVVR